MSTPLSQGRATLIALAALACGAVMVVLVLTSDLEDAQIAWVIVGPAVGWSWVATGLYAWHQRPESRTGLLMVLFGFAWFLAGLHFAPTRALFSLSEITGGLWGGVFLQLVVSFPSGRLRPGLDRALVVAGYVIFTLGSVPAVFFADQDELGCKDCPTNVLLIDRNHDLATIALGFQTLLYAALWITVLVRLVARWRHAEPLERLQLTPVYLCGMLAFLLVTVGTAGVGGAVWWVAFSATALLPFAFLAGLLRSHVARLDAELLARLDELRASRARLVEAGDTERRRLERDLHDGAQARLVGVLLLVSHTRRKVDADPTDHEVPALLERTFDELKTSLAELRELARGIHPSVLTDQGLEPALRALADRCPVPVTLAADPGRDRLPAPVEIAAYFVVAEALANVAKYAQASEATIAVQRTNGRVTVEISDDGIGGADAAQGSGLRGLSDRVAALDGTLSVDSPAGGGTRLHVEIPVGA